MQLKMVIEGGHRLEGEVCASGSKNAALPVLAATLLTRDECVLENVPALTDIEVLIKILQNMGVSVRRREDGAIVTKVVEESCKEAPGELVREMRASICILGPLLARRKMAKIPMPGGCAIGARPVDLHVKGMAKLGASVRVEKEYVEAEASQLHGNEIFLGGAFGSSVLGTANVMMAATLAQGTTVIEFAACEPEIESLAHFLSQMGANISGIGSHRLTIKGVPELHGTSFRIIPDRIEIGTWMAAAAITRGDIIIREICWEHLAAAVDRLGEIGVTIQRLPIQSPGTAERIRVRSDARCHGTELATLPYPGFPTDLQSQFCALLALSEGSSTITEKIFPDRFMHIPELNRMGASITRDGPTVEIHGVANLKGVPVAASDLRASAALVLAGLAAHGTTTIANINHMDRGYENMDAKLLQLGARIRRE